MTHYLKYDEIWLKTVCFSGTDISKEFQELEFCHYSIPTYPTIVMAVDAWAYAIWQRLKQKYVFTKQRIATHISVLTST
jgi:hypothetical protein